MIEQPVHGFPELMEGLTDNYIPVEVPLDGAVIGEILPVRIEGIHGERMKGVLSH